MTEESKRDWLDQILRSLIWVVLVLGVAAVLIGVLSSRTASEGAATTGTPDLTTATDEATAPSPALTGTATSDSGILAATPSNAVTTQTSTPTRTRTPQSPTPTTTATASPTSTIAVTPGTCPLIAARQTTVYAGPGIVYPVSGELAQDTPAISDGWYYAAGYSTWLRITYDRGAGWVRAEDMLQTVDSCITPFVDFSPPPPTYTPTASLAGATFSIPADIGLTHAYNTVLPTSGGSASLVLEVRVEGIRPFYETQDENASRRWLVLTMECGSGAVLWDYYGTSPLRQGCGSSASAVVAAGAPTTLLQFELPQGAPSPAAFTLRITVRDFAEYAP